MPLVFALALLVGWGPDQIQSADLHREAEQLARSGRTADALEHFRRIVEEQPGDVEARLWFARLLRRAGRNNLAEDEFRRALERAPDHADGLTGLAMVLNARGAFEEASALLDRAETLSPANPDVHAARAHGLRLSGRFAQSEASYARARTLSPDDPDIRQGLEQMRRLNRHRVEASFYSEAVTQSLTARAADVNVDLRATEGLRFSGRVQTHTRASQTEGRAGGGMEWRPQPRMTVRFSTLLAPGADVIARSDSVGEVEHARGPFELALAFRHMAFANADVLVLAPAGTLWVNERTAVTVRYYGSRTAFDLRPVATHHSGALRVRHNIHRRIWVDGAYSRGFESFEQLTTDRLGLFLADTFAGGVLWHLPSLQSLAASLEYQRRDDRRTMVRITAGLVHRF